MNNSKKYGLQITYPHWNGVGDDFIFNQWYRKESHRNTAFKCQRKRMGCGDVGVKSVNKVER